MKTLIFIGTLFFTLLFQSVGAEYRVYTDVTEFEKDKGAICEAATDGCNNFMLQDGKVIGGTRMYCKDHTPERTCTKFKEGSITTLSLPVTTSLIQEEPKKCTREYMPVCAKVQIQCIQAPCNSILQTFSNACMAGENDIIFQGTCDSKISKNDISFYNTIKTDRLEYKYIHLVNNFQKAYTNKIGLFHKNKQKMYNNYMSNLIEKRISKLLQKYPQDIALPENINIQYLMLKLLKFEIDILD